MKCPNCETKDLDELSLLCTPIIDYLKQKYDPYTTIQISMDKIEVNNVGMCIPVEKENAVYSSGKGEEVE